MSHGNLTDLGPGSRHYELISKFNFRLKSFFTSMPIGTRFHGDLVYRFKRIMGMTNFSDQFRKIIIHVRHKCIGYDLNVMRQSAC